MPPARCIVACLLAWPVVAEEPLSLQPDAEFLEFLGETADEDEEFVFYMESVEAERAVNRAEAEDTKEEADEK
jgi:hypothetical protein